MCLIIFQRREGSVAIFWVRSSKWALMEWGCCRQGCQRCQGHVRAPSIGTEAGLPWQRGQEQAWLHTSVAAFQSALEPQTFTEHSAQRGKLVSWGLFSLWEKTQLDGAANKDFNIFSQCITHIFQLPGRGLYFWGEWLRNTSKRLRMCKFFWKVRYLIFKISC